MFVVRVFFALVLLVSAKIMCTNLRAGALRHRIFTALLLRRCIAGLRKLSVIRFCQNILLLMCYFSVTSIQNCKYVLLLPPPPTGLLLLLLLLLDIIQMMHDGQCDNLI